MRALTRIDSAAMPERMQFDMQELRLEASRRMTQGLLPRRLQQRMWAGTGDGQVCSLCDRPIDREQIEYELLFATQPATVYRFHRACHDAWERETER